MQAFAKKITSLLDLVFGTMAAAVVCFVMVITCIDVFGRNAFNHPLAGAVELTEMSLFLIIFLMLPQVTLRNQHIVITFLDNRFGWKMDIFQRILNSVLGMGLYSITGWQIWNLGNRSAGISEMTPTLQMPYAPILYAMAILCFVNALAFLLSVASPVEETDIAIG